MINHNETLGRASCPRAARSNNNKSCLSERVESTEIRNTVTDTSGCGENINSIFGLTGYPLASVYAPLQNFEEVYDCETGLTRGTIFPSLDLPFVCGGMNGGVGRG